jgi:hypothetical protein
MHNLADTPAAKRTPSRACRAGGSLCALPALLFLAAVAVHAQAAPRAAKVRFAAASELPAAGMRFRVPPDLSETPVSSPAIQLYQVADRNGSRLVEFLEPRELWRNAQIEGMWSDASGVAFMLATVKTEMPAIESRHLPREAAAAAVARAAAPANWSLDQLTQWVAALAGQPVSATTRVQKPPRTVREAWTLTLGGGSACGVLFRPYVTVSLRRAEAPCFMFAWARVPPGGDAGDVADALRDEFLPSVSMAKPSADTAPQPDVRFQNRRAWDKATATAELEASRKGVAESIRNLRDWWYADTPHYVLLSDLQVRNRQIAREIQARTERYRALFEEVFPPPGPATAVSVIRVFAADEEYDAYVGAEYRWTTGMWVPQRRELVARPIRAEFQRDEQDRFLQVIVHEAFHQYVSASMEPVTPAPWFNEGHACLFAQSTLDHDRMVVSESPLFMPTLEPLAKAGKLDPGRMLAMSYDQFYSSDKTLLALNYATAWGLVYFLHKSAGADAKSAFREVLPRYRMELTAQQEGKPRGGGVVSTIDTQALNREFNAFWLSNSRRQTAKRNPLLVCLP